MGYICKDPINRRNSQGIKQYLNRHFYKLPKAESRFRQKVAADQQIQIDTGKGNAKQRPNQIIRSSPHLRSSDQISMVHQVCRHNKYHGEKPEKLQIRLSRFFHKSDIPRFSRKSFSPCIDKN